MTEKTQNETELSNVGTIDVQKVVVEDPETGNRRVLKGWQYKLAATIAVTASCFHLYTAAFGLFDAMTQ